MDIEETEDYAYENISVQTVCACVMSSERARSAVKRFLTIQAMGLEEAAWHILMQRVQ